MSHDHDSSPDSPVPPSPPEAVHPREPRPLPVPEAFLPAEPAPGGAIAIDGPARLWPDGVTLASTPDSPLHPEVSWRSLAGARRDPEPGGPTEAGTIPPPGADTTIGSLGDEPMGGAPREEPAQPATELDPSAAVTVPQPPKESSVTIGRIGEELFAWLKTLASAAVYATLIVTFGFQVARVEGQSMAPTLEDQDRLIVNKLAYRIGDPQVGDIVMLYYPLNPEKSFVKRVIAEENDQIRIVDGRVYRNDVLINDDYVPSQFRSHDDYGPEVVPQGYYFVMGDHRNNSSDSRHWKFVPKKYIIGKVQLRWWPIPSARVF